MMMDDRRYVLRGMETINFSVPEPVLQIGESPNLYLDTNDNPIGELIESYVDMIRAIVADVWNQLTSDISTSEYPNPTSVKYVVEEFYEYEGFANIQVFTLESDDEYRTRMVQKERKEQTAEKRRIAAAKAKVKKVAKDREADLATMRMLAAKHKVTIVV
jgi:hypothetical protein